MKFGLRPSRSNRSWRLQWAAPPPPARAGGRRLGPWAVAGWLPAGRRVSANYAVAAPPEQGQALAPASTPGPGGRRVDCEESVATEFVRLRVDSTLVLAVAPKCGALTGTRHV